MSARIGFPSSLWRYLSTARRSEKSSSGSPWSSQILKTNVSTLVWVSLRPSTLDSKRGPKPATVARSCAPVFPVRLTNSTGNAVGVHARPTAVARSSMAGLLAPGAARPDTSPLMSATKTGTPCAESCSVMSWRVLVFPVPVAPATKPCRFIMAVGMATFGSCTTPAPSIAAPSEMTGEAKA